MEEAGGGRATALAKSIVEGLGPSHVECHSVNQAATLAQIIASLQLNTTEGYKCN